MFNYIWKIIVVGEKNAPLFFLLCLVIHLSLPIWSLTISFRVKTL